MNGGTPAFVNTTFDANTAKGYGGGLHFASAATATFVRTLLLRNRASKSGGGISVQPAIDLPSFCESVSSLILRDNWALDSGGGLFVKLRISFGL